MQNSLAPIILFVYNRPEHTLQTLHALMENELANESELFIYADGEKQSSTATQRQQIVETREVIRQKQWCKKVTIIESAVNHGLAASIIKGVTDVLEKYEKIIVLEDDIITSTHFLKYMNEGLELFHDKEKVMHISAYMFPVTEKLPEIFFFNTASCWGWGTWKDAWKHFEKDAKKSLTKILNKNLVHKFNLEDSYDYYSMLKRQAEGINDSWAVRWYASIFLNNGLCLHPSQSLVNNIGHDGTGVHCNNTNVFKIDDLSKSIEVRDIPLKENKRARESVKKFYKKQSIKLIHKITNKMHPRIKHTLKYLYDTPYRKLHKELHRILQIPRFKTNTTNLFENEFHFVDSASFLFIYNEVFKRKIYQFKSDAPKPYIIDCGANVGLSVLFFKQIYPTSEIIAFEPDPKVFNVLFENVKQLNLPDIMLINKAVWDHNTTLNFSPDGADAGRLDTTKNEHSYEVETTTLSQYLTRTVDLLKIDIEGAEFTVLKNIKNSLKNVQHLFVEYHSFSGEPTVLNEILGILTEYNFRYYIESVGIKSPQPFMKINSFMGMDNQLNIFAYKI
ncbi:MAG: FkbM family methyltransferase [Bacteroidia bacterium]